LVERLRCNANRLDFVAAFFKCGLRLTKHGDSFLDLLSVLGGFNPHKSSDGADFRPSLAPQSRRNPDAYQRGCDHEKEKERTAASVKKRMHAPPIPEDVA
jgi:hypothetical protein